VKTTLLILSLMCLGLRAQAQDTNDSAESARRREMLTRALREAMAASATNAPAAPVMAPPVTTVSAGSNTLPAAVAIPPATTATVVVQPVPAVTTTAPQTVAPVVPAAAAPVATPPAAAQPAPPAMAVAPGTPPPPLITFPEPAPAGERLIPPGDMYFPNTDLGSVLEIYGKFVGRTVIKDPKVVSTAQIYLMTQTDLTKTEAIQALDTVLAMNGVAMIPFGEKFVKAVPANESTYQGAEFTYTDPSKLPIADQFVNYVMQTKYVKPSDLTQVISPMLRTPQNMQAFDSSMLLVIRDYSANVKRVAELVNKLDTTITSEFDSEVIPIKYAQASDIAGALSSLGAGATSGIGGGSSRGGGGGRGGATSAGGVTGGYSTPGSGGLGGNQLGQRGAVGGTLGGAAANNPNASFTDRLRGILGTGGGATGDIQLFAGHTKIVPDERSNSLLVFANKQDMVTIKKIIDQLDTVLAQVIIETIIMEVSLDDSRNIGFSYVQNQPSQPGHYFSGIGAINNGALLNNANFLTAAGTNAGSGPPGGFSYFGNFGNDFQATLTAIATDGRVKVLSCPHIQTSHGVPASIRIGDNVPMVTGTYFGGLNGTANSQYQQTFVGIGLDVTPWINSEGLVVMKITQDIQQLGTPTTIDGNSVPQTTQRYADATVSVRDRETIVLGGFISSSTTKSRSGVPFLKDIPGLGVLFSSTADSNKRVELVVLIRPMVLPKPEDAALAVKDELKRLPAVKSLKDEWDAAEGRKSKSASAK
jgi:general secretion pathway protein D